MIIRRHGYDPDREVVSLLTLHREYHPTDGSEQYVVQYVVNAPVVEHEIVANVYMEDGNLIIHTPENW